MHFELVPTLERLRAVYAVPRGKERFQAYIDAVVGGAQTTSEVALPPLVSANPMAREAGLACVDGWLALNAEPVAREVLRHAEADLPEPALTVRVGLAVLDDVDGGWTERFISDAARFQTGLRLRQSGWISVPLWTGEAPSLAALRLTVREAAWRAAEVARRGDPPTLRAMLRQEGQAAAFAGRVPVFGAEELEYTRAVLAPHLDSDHQPTAFAAMYGDEGARAWGYPPLGLSLNAGFQLGLADALRTPR